MQSYRFVYETVRYEQNVWWIRSTEDINDRKYTLVEELKCEDGVM